MPSVALLFLLVLCGAASAFCPNKCTCTLDSKGRNTVTCLEGGIVGALDLFNMSLDTEVLKISAPEDNMNQLTMSPVFHSYKKLEEIYITRSNIPQLGMHFFWALKKLDVLDLSQNNITQPLDHNFIGLLGLKELYLDDNRIYSLPSGTFRHLQELKVLSIQRNRITELMPRIFLEIRKLKVLRLSGNDLNQLNPVVFEDVNELKSLECRSCGLTKIDKHVYELLPHLTHLDLGDNSLSSITLDEFTPVPNLRHLKLDGNRLTSIKPSVFTNQHELKKLNLARNGLTQLTPALFESLHNLTELDLSFNKIKAGQSGVLEPVSGSLQVLVLSGNHLTLTSLKRILKNLQVRELKLRKCALGEVVGRVFPESVQVLDLGQNHISAMSAESVPERLERLDIAGNRFKGLDLDLLVRLDDLKGLRLEKNPWSCDLCHIVPLLERANKSASIRSVECHQPYSVKGRQLGSLRRSELTWCTVSRTSDANYFLLGDDGEIGLIAAASSGCLLLLTVFALAGIFLYSRRHAAKYYTHEDKLAIDSDAVLDNHSPLFGDERELSFKFPLASEKKLAISTIDEIKKEHAITNGT